MKHLIWYLSKVGEILFEKYWVYTLLVVGFLVCFFFMTKVILWCLSNTKYWFRRW